MHTILVITLYFPLDALHVSDSVSPSSGTTFYKLYIVFGICPIRLTVVWLWPHNSQTYRLIPVYTKCDVQFIKLLLMID